MRLFSFLTLATWLMYSSFTYAQPTQIMIRAKAVDAKFIGSSVGGIKAVVEDAETGEILDQGWVNGNTGSTDVLIKTPLKRGELQSDDKTAGFLANIDINTPRLLRIKLIGPYGYRQSLQEATVTSWAIPGKDILGDGIILNMPGFIVDSWTQVLEGGRVDIYTKASMLCGCPIRPDGYWDPEKYQVSAIIMQNEKKLDELELDFTGPVGLFSTKTKITKPGHYKVIVYVIDQKTGNVGVDRTMFEVPEQ